MSEREGEGGRDDKEWREREKLEWMRSANIINLMTDDL